MLIRTLYFEQTSIIAAVVRSLIVAGLLKGISRMACASAEEKINEPAGRFLRPRDDIMRPKVLAPAVVS
jgi:hypothetical protein